MSMNICIGDPKEVDLLDPTPERVPISFPCSGAGRPQGAAVEVAAKDGFTILSTYNATSDDDGNWSVNVAGLPKNKIITLHAKLTVGLMTANDFIQVLTVQ